MSENPQNNMNKESSESRRWFLKKILSSGAFLSAFTLLSTSYPKKACADPVIRVIQLPGLTGYPYSEWWHPLCGTCTANCAICRCGCPCDCTCTDQVPSYSTTSTGDNGGGMSLATSAQTNTAYLAAYSAWQAKRGY